MATSMVEGNHLLMEPCGGVAYLPENRVLAVWNRSAQTNFSHTRTEFWYAPFDPFSPGIHGVK